MFFSEFAFEKPLLLDGSAGAALAPVALQYVEPFFVTVNGGDLNQMEMPEYDSIFQGN